MSFGFLSGKYDRETVEGAAPRSAGLPKEAAAAGVQRPEGDKRLDGANPFGDTLFTERNWKIVETLKQVAKEAGETPAGVALAWVTQQAGVTSTLMGVSRVEQVAENIASLKLVLSAEHRAALDSVSAPEPRMLYSLFTQSVRQFAVYGGSAVKPWGA